MQHSWTSWAHDVPALYTRTYATPLPHLSRTMRKWCVYSRATASPPLPRCPLHTYILYSMLRLHILLLVNSKVGLQLIHKYIDSEPTPNAFKVKWWPRWCLRCELWWCFIVEFGWNAYLHVFPKQMWRAWYQGHIRGPSPQPSRLVRPPPRNVGRPSSKDGTSSHPTPDGWTPRCGQAMRRSHVDTSLMSYRNS